MKKEQAQKLRVLLEQVAEEYNSSNEVVADAIAPALKYQDWHSKELASFICSVIAYGRVEHIKKSIGKLLDGMGDNPHQWLMKSKEEDLKRLTKNWCHRFNTEADAFHLLLLLKTIYQEHKSIELFLSISPHDQARDVIERFVVQSEVILKKNKWKVKKSFWFFFPKPSVGSACKRMNLYLRWMVGQSAQDFGLWKSMAKRNLVIPLDVHILNQARSLKLTKRKQADWKTVEEVTEKLRLMDPEDPTRFDFALCHLGMNGKILKASLLTLALCVFSGCATAPQETQTIESISIDPTIEKTQYPKEYEELTGGEQAKLHQAIRSDDLEKVKFFFDRGVDPNTLIKDSAGYATSPLHESITAGSTKVFDYLISKKAKVDHIKNPIETELIVAIIENKKEMVIKLLEAGANPNHVTGETKESPLMTAARLKQSELIKKMIDKKAKVDLKNDGGYTALMYAAEYGCTDCVQILLASGAKKNLKNLEGKTALELATIHKRETIQGLLK